MVKQIIKHILIFTLIIGTFNVAAIMIAEGLSGIDATNIVGNGTFVTKYNIPNTDLIWYKIDLPGYLQNLQRTLQFNNSKTIIQSVPNFPVGTYFENMIEGLVNIGIWIVNFLSWLINVTILTPVKIAVYPIWVVMALLGSNLGEIQNLINGIYNIYIPPIDYVNITL